MADTGAMKVWVLDMVGYDVGGGLAQVFSSVEAAKASRPVEWEWEEHRGWWVEKTAEDSIAPVWIIYKREVHDG
jgi:hypothetical protein